MGVACAAEAGVEGATGACGTASSDGVGIAVVGNGVVGASYEARPFPGSACGVEALVGSMVAPAQMATGQVNCQPGALRRCCRVVNIFSHSCLGRTQNLHI